MKAREIIYIIVILLCLAGMYECYKSNNQYKSLAIAAADTLMKTRNNLGQEKTATALLYGTIKDFKAMRFADSSAMGKLQKMVDNLTISATYLRTATTNNFTSASQIISGDTVVKDSLIYVYPRYHTDTTTRWTKYSITATRDSFHIAFTAFNEYQIKQEWKRNGFLKRKTMQASVINLNPNTSTLQFQTFTIAENKSNRMRDFLFGALAGSIVTQAAIIKFKK